MPSHCLLILEFLRTLTSHLIFQDRHSAYGTIPLSGRLLITMTLFKRLYLGMPSISWPGAVCPGPLERHAQTPAMRHKGRHKNILKARRHAFPAICSYLNALLRFQKERDSKSNPNSEDMLFPVPNPSTPSNNLFMWSSNQGYIHHGPTNVQKWCTIHHAFEKIKSME